MFPSHRHTCGNTTATYDAASRLLSQTDVTGRLIEYDYDPNGRMELVEDPTSWASYEYDARGRMTKETFSNGVYSQYGYDNASRLTSLNHKKTVDGSLILGYAATYDAASRLTQAVESPVPATTTYAYDNANRLTSEDRTGANPYLSDYTYNSRGLRATAHQSDDGVQTQDASYSYDATGRPTLVVESMSGTPVNEVFAWWADNTLKSYPRSGLTKLMDYDEEGQLTSISDDDGTTQTLRYQYEYGFDGGRRWRKDVAQNIWNWYPCGVACCAGELAILACDLSDQVWSTEETMLGGVHMSRVGGYWVSRSVASDSLPAMVTDSSATRYDLLRDAFLVLRQDSGDLYSWLVRIADIIIDALTKMRDHFADLARRRPTPVVPEAPRTPRVVPKHPSSSGFTPLPNPGSLFQCNVKLPGWWAKRTPGAHATWCDACGTACALACGDDIDCIIICAGREVACRGNGGNFVF